MELKTRTIEELKNIVEKDYGVLLSDEDADTLGSAILRITRLAAAAIARASERELELVRTLPYRKNKVIK